MVGGPDNPKVLYTEVSSKMNELSTSVSRIYSFYEVAVTRRTYRRHKAEEGGETRGTPPSPAPARDSLHSCACVASLLHRPSAHATPTPETPPRSLLLRPHLPPSGPIERPIEHPLLD